VDEVAIAGIGTLRWERHRFRHWLSAARRAEAV